MTNQNSTEYCTFDELLDSVDLELSPICTALRDAIFSLHQDCVEIIWKNQRIASYGVGSKKMSEHYAYIAPHKKHVNLGFYHGASLVDPGRLLEGTGKRLRHVKIRSIMEAKSAPLKRLIAEAIAERKAALA